MGSVKVAKMLLDEGSISQDVVLMVDEMHLQKATQFHGGQYVGADNDGELFSGIVCFMVVGLKKSVPLIVRAVPETTVKGGCFVLPIGQNEGEVNALTKIK